MLQLPCAVRVIRCAFVRGSQSIGVAVLLSGDW
jgi:hypothetical protein